MFGLTDSGVCAAFDVDTGRRTCILNTGPHEVIRSLFHNKSNKTLIIVSVYQADQYSSLRCRAASLDDLRRGIADQSSALFGSELLRWPGFVEFDDVNQKVLTYSAGNTAPTPPPPLHFVPPISPPPHLSHASH